MASSPSLRIPARLLAELHDARRAAGPDEACGCLVGRVGSHGVHRVDAAPRLPNLARGPHFDLDPVALVAAERVARAAGRRVLGVWHTHPASRARLGAADRRGAVAGWSQLVLGEGPGGRPEARSWRGTPSGPVEERLGADSA